MIPPNLKTSHADAVDRIFYQAANSTMGITMTIPEYIAAEADFTKLVDYVTRRPRHDIDDILDFCEDHNVVYSPFNFNRPIGPPPLRIHLDDPMARYKFWMSFP